MRRIAVLAVLVAALLLGSVPLPPGAEASATGAPGQPSPAALSAPLPGAHWIASRSGSRPTPELDLSTPRPGERSAPSPRPAPSEPTASAGLVPRPISHPPQSERGPPPPVA